MRTLLAIYILTFCTLIKAQNTPNCSRKVNFGDISICLPKIEEMNECYNQKIVKEKADKNEIEQTELLGFYLNDFVFGKIDKLNEFDFDDYFKIYSFDFAKGINFKTSDLDKMSDMITGNGKLIGWDKIIKELNNNPNSTISFDRPIYVDKYVVNDKSRTSIFINRIKNNDKQYYILGSINTMVIKNRVIFLSYYLNFEDSSSLENFKKKNNEIVLKIQKANQ